MLKCEDYFNVLKNKFKTFVIQQIVNNNKHIQTAKSTLFQGIIVQRLAARCITDITDITDINEELYTKAEYLQSIGECAAAVVLLDKAISYGHLPSRALKAFPGMRMERLSWWRRDRIWVAVNGYREALKEVANYYKESIPKNVTKAEHWNNHAISI